MKTKEKHEKDFCGMDTKEKEEFLSNDLIERMIRVEQRVSAKFNKFIRYNETRYYQTLSEKKKKDFEKYLKTHKRRKFIFSFLLCVISVFLFFALRSGFTGRAISENLGESALLPVRTVLVLLLGLIVVSFIIYRIFKSQRQRKINGAFEIMDNWIYGRLGKK